MLWVLANNFNDDIPSEMDLGASEGVLTIIDLRGAVVDPSIVAAIRATHRARRLRARLFGAETFTDPTWDILLYMFTALQDGRAVCVKEACSATEAPTSTARRRVQYLVAEKYLYAEPNPWDGRATLLSLTEFGQRRMVEFFGALPALAEAEVQRCTGAADRVKMNLSPACQAVES